MDPIKNLLEELQDDLIEEVKERNAKFPDIIRSAESSKPLSYNPNPVRTARDRHNGVIDGLQIALHLISKRIT